MIDMRPFLKGASVAAITGLAFKGAGGFRRCCRQGSSSGRLLQRLHEVPTRMSHGGHIQGQPAGRHCVRQVPEARTRLPAGARLVFALEAAVSRSYALKTILYRRAGGTWDVSGIGTSGFAAGIVTQADQASRLAGRGPIQCHPRSLWNCTQACMGRDNCAVAPMRGQRAFTISPNFDEGRVPALRHPGTGLSHRRDYKPARGTDQDRDSQHRYGAVPGMEGQKEARDLRGSVPGAGGFGHGKPAARSRPEGMRGMQLVPA